MSDEQRPGLKAYRQIFSPRSLSMETRFLAWLFIILIPVLLLRGAFHSVIRQEEIGFRQLVVSDLMNEMERFLLDMRLENYIEGGLAQAETRLGFPAADSPRMFRFSKGMNSPLAASGLAGKIASLTEEQLGCRPVMVFAAGPDGKEVDLAVDERLISRVQAPSRRSVQLFLWELSNQCSRKAWLDEKFLEGLRRQWETPAGREKRKTELERFNKMTFGLYSNSFGPSGQCRSLYTHRFGGERLILYHRFLTANEAQDAPLIGGYCIVFRESALPWDSVVKKSMKKSATPGIWRDVRWRDEMHGAGVFQNSQAVSYYHPLPIETFTSGTLQGKSLAQTLARREKNSETPSRVPFLTVRKTVESLKHPWQAYFRKVDGFLAAGVLLALFITLRPVGASGSSSLRIWEKLFLAVGLAILFPLIAFWIVTGAYLTFKTRLEVRRQLFHMNEKLEMIEAGIDGFDKANQAKFAQLQGALATLMDSPVDTIKQALDVFLAEETVSQAHLIRSDGTMVTRISPKMKKMGNVFEMETRNDYFMNAIGLGIFREMGVWTPEASERFKTLPKGKFIHAVSENIDSGEIQEFLQDVNATLRPKVGGADDRQYSMNFIFPGEGQDPRPRNILFMAEPFAEMVKSYLKNLSSDWGRFYERNGDFTIRTALFQTNDLKHSNLIPNVCWPPNAVKDDRLVQLAKQSLKGGRDGAWDVFTQGKSELFAVRRLNGFPFIAVSHGEFQGVLEEKDLRRFLPLFGGYSLIVVTLLAVLLSRVFIRPMKVLLSGSAEVAAGKTDFETGISTRDEFADLGGEFDRMVRGMGERDRLRRFISEETAEAVKKDSEESLQPGGTRVHRAILFSHIRDFASLTEIHPPEKIVELLNGYFTLMDEAVKAEGGRIDKFISDAVMAVFSPSPGKIHESLQACRAAIRMKQALIAFNDSRARAGLFPVTQGIGIASGDVISGRIGSEEGRISMTVIGDTVNLAARLESSSEMAIHSGIVCCGRTAQTVIPILGTSLQTWRGVSTGGRNPSPQDPVLHCVPLGEIRVKGKQKAVPIFELLLPES